VPTGPLTDKTGEGRTLLELLTPRLFEVVGLVATGHKNSEIAREMSISELVVKNYLKQIYDRAGCWNRLELALRYTYEFERGLYPRPTPPGESGGSDTPH
jgi:DNA-binding NarL/FixJ family response regulator